ncbi:unnamed protein product [Alopecurus aequalis]
MADSLIRLKAWEALTLHGEGDPAEALDRAIALARANPRSAPALNLAGSLHAYAASRASEEMPPGGDEAASALVSHHHRAAVDAYAAASWVAPNCVMTAFFHAEALANDHRFADAMLELNRVLMMTTNHDDPGVHHVVYDLIGGDPKGRKGDAVNKASTFMEKLAARINNEIGREVAPRGCHCWKGLLRRVLGLVSDAADSFDSSLLIALFHAKVLFVLDMFDESEGECRRALRIEEPTDPNLDDIPPAVSVPGADCDARVSSLKKQLRVLLKQIIVVAGLCWSSIQTTQHRERVISVRVHTLQEHYDGIDQPAAKTISGAVRFLKNQGSWSFFICTNSSCDGKKFVDTGSLWEHMRSKHRDELWTKLRSVLGPDHNENASKDDHSLDGITLSQDSGQHDIFHLPSVQDMFESFLFSPSIGIQAEPLGEMRRRKCREGAEILEDIKKKMRMLPKDKISTEIEMKRLIAHSAKDLGISSQSVKEMASTSSSQQSPNVFNKNNADKDLSILSLIIRSLCNLRHFRDKLLTDPLAWIPSVDNPCIAQKFYEIFYSWEQNDHHLTDAVLTYIKTLLCRILYCTTFSEKVGTNFASDIVATILIELHMSETCSRFSLNKEIDKHVVNPITCGDCICPTHNIFGVKFNAQMSCKCGKCSEEYLYSALFHKLDAGSPQTTKIKSFAELPVLLDEQFFLSWLGSSESQDTLSEVLAGITSPVDTGFLCKSADSSTMYTVTSMICCADESYVCFARDDEDKWLIYGFETVETQDTWEHLLARFKDCKLHPEVLFFEVIK